MPYMYVCMYVCILRELEAPSKGPRRPFLLYLLVGMRV